MGAGAGTTSLDIEGAIPRGLDPWLVEVIEEARRENEILRENGAEPQARAREALIRKLLGGANEWLNAEIGVPEAARMLGRCEETARRAIRDGDLPDRRSNPRGNHKTRRGDVLSLARKRITYDPSADALDIARRRKGAA